MEPPTRRAAGDDVVDSGPVVDAGSVGCNGADVACCTGVGCSTDDTGGVAVCGGVVEFLVRRCFGPISIIVARISRSVAGGDGDVKTGTFGNSDAFGGRPRGLPLPLTGVAFSSIPFDADAPFVVDGVAGFFPDVTVVDVSAGFAAADFGVVAGFADTPPCTF